MSTAVEMAQGLQTKVGKAAYVQFDKVAKHLPRQSEAEGRYIAVDVDIVMVRQMGGVDSVIFEVTRWLKQNEVEVQSGRMPAEHAALYARAYETWKTGQEMPLEGTPIKGWAVITPAQAQMVIQMGIRTVEDLATLNAEGRQRLGMGAQTLQNKAMAWVSQAQEKGPATMEIASLKDRNTLLEANVATMQRQIDELKSLMPRTIAQPVEETPEITATDILDKPERPARKR